MSWPGRRAALLALALALPAPGEPRQAARIDVRLDAGARLEFVNATARFEEYRGRPALKLMPLPGHERAVNEEMLSVVDGPEFDDGTLEVDVAGARRAGYSTVEDVRGFKGIVGLSFRVSGEQRETLYLRPENARLDDQLFRNRATQYESMPGYPWNRLREESPGLYESYVDLVPGAWTHLKIEVSGTRARLFVDGAAQPCLVVNDLKQGRSRGRIALYARVSTEAYFANLRVTPRS